ncbi:MAG TPA: SIR2 family protein [Steroidobacteraceae bacterium]|nr:SIR2 family protein [Steroidobacteraceae bacterium]
MDQTQLTSLFSARPQNFGWFLGAGSSVSAGLPTATDIIWDMKRRYYCREENQDISRQDMQSEAVRQRIQSYMLARGFPPEGADDEYTGYFEKIFGDGKERQRRYIGALLAEDRVRLSVGSRVLGALLGGGFSRIAFTTNFDTVIEKAVAEVAGQSLMAFHLEGSAAANAALNNEEFPIYCKLHGDFRYDSIKNLTRDLARQNDALAQCFVNAGSRFGFIVAGYSGRDASVMHLFHSVLEHPNPFPNGLLWTGIKGRPITPVVSDLLAAAKAKGVHAEYVPIETFDALLLRLWRNIERKPQNMDQKIRKASITSVQIPLPVAGTAKPLVRLNALPIHALPTECLSLSFSAPAEWSDLQQVERNSGGELFLSKGEIVYGWGLSGDFNVALEGKLTGIAAAKFPANIDVSPNLHLKRMAETALAYSLALGKPLLVRNKYHACYLIADAFAEDKSLLQPLAKFLGRTNGIVAGVMTEVTEEFPKAEQVHWAEALRFSIDRKGDGLWLLLEPEVWIWPVRGRKLATDFLDKRIADRYNAKFNGLLDVWIKLILGDAARNAEVNVSPLRQGTVAENPVFKIGTRTGFSKRLSA